MADNLVLGWRVTSSLDPAYWLSPKAVIGGHTTKDLVQVSADSIDKHTVIIAQSGSGKSFFLGRLIEEIQVKTRARCLILDPNGDFLRCKLVSSRDELWERPAFDNRTRMGYLTHDRKHDFEQAWASIGIRISSQTTTEPLSVPWGAVSADVLAASADGLYRDDVTNCHLIVRALLMLTPGRTLNGTMALSASELLDEAESIIGDSTDPEQLRRRLIDDYCVQKLAKQAAALKNPSRKATDWEVEVELESLDAAVETVTQLRRYVSTKGAMHYFGRARILLGGRVFVPAASLRMDPRRLSVFDLSSISEDELRLVVSSVIADEKDRARAAWRRQLQGFDSVDQRVPTFIVIDEAHNLIPEDPPSPAARLLRDQLRTIAAEGRKYGLFLVLVSQRPDKLDRLAVSECENKVVMRLGGAAVLHRTKELLGLDDIPERQLKSCLSFRSGRGILAGAWARHAYTLFFAAARRTEEGGRSLNSRFWANSDRPKLESVVPPSRKKLAISKKKRAR